MFQAFAIQALPEGLWPIQPSYRMSLRLIAMYHSHLVLRATSSNINPLAGGNSGTEGPSHLLLARSSLTDPPLRPSLAGSKRTGQHLSPAYVSPAGCPARRTAQNATKHCRCILLLRAFKPTKDTQSGSGQFLASTTPSSFPKSHVTSMQGRKSSGWGGW